MSGASDSNRHESERSSRPHQLSTKPYTKISEPNCGLQTVLVAVDDAETRRTLVDGLRQDDRNILEAPDLPSMVEAVLTQSKPIHLLLIDVGTDKRTWATRLMNHRQKMIVFLVAEHQDGQLPDVLTPTLALSAVRAFFKSRGEATKGSVFPDKKSISVAAVA